MQNQGVPAGTPWFCAFVVFSVFLGQRGLRRQGQQPAELRPLGLGHSLGHPGKAAVDLLLDGRVDLPGGLGGADVVGALVPGALAAL